MVNDLSPISRIMDLFLTVMVVDCFPNLQDSGLFSNLYGWFLFPPPLRLMYLCPTSTIVDLFPTFLVHRSLFQPSGLWDFFQPPRLLIFFQLSWLIDPFSNLQGYYPVFPTSIIVDLVPISVIVDLLLISVVANLFS